MERLIIPCLEQGTTVISVRYFLSTCAFGGINLDMEWLIELNDKFMLPDITFLLDVSPEVCLKRIKRRCEGFEYFEELDKLAEVEQNYKKLLGMFDNVHLIDGEWPKKIVAKNILEIFFHNV